jgi:hypothetical protein
LNKLLLLTLVLLICFFGLALWAMAYRDGPPPAHTGGFGEPTCHLCHFDNLLAESSDSLTVSAPGQYVSGESYDVTVRLTHDGMRNAGFQLTTRFKDSGGQAGVLRPLDAGTEVVRQGDRSPDYLQHNREGQRLAGPGEAVWQFQWEAPMSSAPVLLHVAANAANQDDSEFGDFVHTQAILIPGVDPDP